MNLKTNQNTNGHGGARPGAGRPKGSTPKIRVEDLLDQIEMATGKSYAEVLAWNYAGAITRSDWSQVSIYDRAFLNKIVADKTEVEIIGNDEMVELRQAAFAEAINQLNQAARTRPDNDTK